MIAAAPVPTKMKYNIGRIMRSRMFMLKVPVCVSLDYSIADALKRSLEYSTMFPVETSPPQYLTHPNSACSVMVGADFRKNPLNLLTKCEIPGECVGEYKAIIGSSVENSKYLDC